MMFLKKIELEFTRVLLVSVQEDSEVLSSQMHSPLERV